MPYLFQALYIPPAHYYVSPGDPQFEKNHKMLFFFVMCYIFYSIGLIGIQPFNCIWDSEKPESHEANGWQRLDSNLMDLSNSHSQVLQKLGKTVETKDERFEQSANNFYHQQVIWGRWGVGKGGLEEARRQEGWMAEETAGSANQQVPLLSHPPTSSPAQG